MDIELAAMTSEVVGTVFVAFAALRVHHRVLNEHSIDDMVFNVMRVEQKIGVLGVLFVLGGYLLQVGMKFGFF